MKAKNYKQKRIELKKEKRERMKQDFENTKSRKKFVEEFQLADDTLSDERKTKRMDCSGCQLSVKWNQCSESGGLKEISG